MTEESEFESQWGQELLLVHAVQTGFGAYQDSYSMGTRSLSPGVKGPGRETGHSSPTSAEVKKTQILGIYGTEERIDSP
jgi:hypothetical protein